MQVQLQQIAKLRDEAMEREKKLHKKKRGKYQTSEGRETESRDESRRHLRVGAWSQKKRGEERECMEQTGESRQGPRVKKEHSYLMGNKEGDIGKGMDVPVMEQMMRRSRGNKDRVPRSGGRKGIWGASYGSYAKRGDRKSIGGNGQI